MRKWTYLFLYNDSLASFETIKKFLDARPEILNWYTCLPNSFFIVSCAGASALNEVFSKKFKKQVESGARYIILNAATDKNGWLPPHAWTFMAEPKAVDEA